MTDHEPLTRNRHAELVVEMLHNNPRLWAALYRPSVYVYDERDHQKSIQLELDCRELRLAFNGATDWETAMYQLRELIRLDDWRRTISIGVRVNGRVILGEAV